MRQQELPTRVLKMNKSLKYEDIINTEGKLVWKIQGVSMLPLIKQDRDIVVIRKISDELKKYDVVLFKRHNLKTEKDDYVLHRILKVNGDGTYYIVGDNCISGDVVKKENIIGILDGIVRNGKDIRLNGCGYRLYLFFVGDLYKVRIFNKRQVMKLKSVIKHILECLKASYQ